MLTPPLSLSFQVPYYCDDRPRYKRNWLIPMEYCERNPETLFCVGRSYQDSLNSFHAGKTVVDYELLAGGITTQEAFRQYQGWVSSFAK